MDLQAYNKLSYGVYIIASGDKDKKNAFVCTAAIQVTADPPKIAVVCNKNNHTTGIIKEKKNFSVSVLSQNYQPLTLGTFGFRTGKDFDKFGKATFIYGTETGVPIVLDDIIAWFECELEQSVDVGTHIIFVGKVLQSQTIAENETPLTYKYYHEIKKGIVHKNAPSNNQ